MSIKVSILLELRKRFRYALQHAGLLEGLSSQDIEKLLRTIRPIKASQVKHGDYQTTMAMSLSRKFGCSFSEIVTRIVEHLDIADLCELEVGRLGIVTVRKLKGE